MVRVIQHNAKNLYQCEECGFYYKEKEWAEKCEQWCREHKSCNLEITSHAAKEIERLSKKERKEQKRLAKQKFRLQRRAQKIVVWAAVLILAGLVLFAGWKWLANQPAAPASEIISTGGIHWHPHLSITILGEQQEIPAGIGLGITERPIHTHEADGIIHLEFSGRVTEDNVRLGEFFKTWGKEFSSQCIFDKCNGPEGQVKMFVNGEPNVEFENYVMRDRDEIEIIFENPKP